jgi:hypothetical protein
MKGLRDGWELLLRVRYGRASGVDNTRVDLLEYIANFPEQATAHSSALPSPRSGGSP